MIALPKRELGSVRTIFIGRRHVFKLPGRWTFRRWRWWWDSLLRGLLSNMQERAFAREGWPELCPITFSLPGGFLVVMRRAHPLTNEEWLGFDYLAFVTRGDAYAEENFDRHASTWKIGRPGPAIVAAHPGQRRAGAGIVPVEYKRDSFGVLGGRIVAVDYV